MSNKVRDIIYIGIFAVLISICAWITVPTAVPFTLQSMGVFTAVGLLGGKRGSLAVVTYILLGMIGLPVFSGFSGGIGVILNATGGYIIGFLLLRTHDYDYALRLGIAAGSATAFSLGLADKAAIEALI